MELPHKLIFEHKIDYKSSYTPSVYYVIIYYIRNTISFDIPG